MLRFFLASSSLAAFAQVAAPAEFGLKEISEYGVIAIALFTVLYRIEPQLKGIVQSLNYLTQMIGLMLVEIKSTSEGVKAQAQELMNRMKGDDK